MTDERNNEITCEYYTVRSNENKCKALDIEFHNCLNILEQKKCPIYKLKQRLQAKELECASLKLRFEKLYQFNKKLIAKNFEIGCRNIRYKNLCNEIEEISTTAYCLTNGTNKDMSDFAKQIINNINRTKEENQCEQ